MPKLPYLTPEASLLQSMQVIDDGAVEIALLVDKAQRLIGTLTDGDIRRAILGGAQLTDPVGDHSHRTYTAVSAQTSRAEVLDLMRARQLSQIPILDDTGRLQGLHLLHEIVGVVPRPNWAVIMAGGRGERLRPLTDTVPKPLLPVAGRPILERIILHLVGSGIRRVFLAVNYLGEQIEAHFGDGREFGCQIEYLREEIPLGTGGALSLLPESPSDPILVLNGDLLSQFNVGRLLEHQKKSASLACVAVHHHRYTVPFGVVETEQGLLRDLSEKPTQSWAVNAGIYVLDPKLLQRIPQGQLFPLPALLEDCLQRGEPVLVHQLEDDWMDVGLPQQLKQARGET